MFFAIKIFEYYMDFLKYFLSLPHRFFVRGFINIIAYLDRKIK